MRSESSRTEIDLSSSIHSWVLVAMFLFLRGGLSGSVAMASAAGAAAAGAAAPPIRPWSAIACSWRARPAGRLFRAVTRPLSGEAIMPTRRPMRTSRLGSWAMASTSSGVSGLAVHPAALELQQRAAGAAAEVAQRLGGRGGVAADERHRRRALQELLQPVGADLVGGTLGERVLDDA